IDSPGNYLLELALRPTVRVTDRMSEFQFAIPSLATSTLDLALPAGGANVTAPLAYGQTQLLDQGRRLHARLGPAERLVVRWNERLTQTVEADAEIEELLWLNVRPGSVVVDAQFNLRVLKGSIQHMLLLVDPRLRLLPTNQLSPVAEVRTLDGQSNISGAP